MSKLTLSLIFALTACGSVEHFDDANNGQIDGHPSPDAEATTGTANVTTYNLCCNGAPHTPVAGIDVVVTAPDGTQRDFQISDGSGTATVDVHAGDSVTAIYKDVGRASMVTIAAVKPNDHLQFGAQFQPNNVSPNPVGTATANFGNIGTNYNVYVYSACTSGFGDPNTLSATLTFYDNCPQTTQLLYYATDSTTGAITYWARVASVNTHQTTSIPAPTWQNATGFTMSATGVPAEVTDVRMQVQDYVGPYYAVETQYEAVPVNGSLTTTTPFINGDPLATLVVYSRDVDTGLQGEFDVLPANSVQFAVVNPGLLPWMGLLTFDPATETANVPIESGASYDATVYEVTWNRYPADGGSESYDWIVVAPPGTDSVVLPAMTGNDAYVMPMTTDSINSYNQAIILDYASAANYDQVRAKPEWELLPFSVPTEDIKLAVSASPRPTKQAAGHPLFSFPAADKLVR